MYLTRGMDSIDFTNSTEGILHQMNVGCGFHWVFVTDLQVINMPEHKQQCAFDNLISQDKTRQGLDG